MPSARLLLVEDEPGLQLTLSDRLAAEGYAVETAGDGDTAIRRGGGEPFDLIVLDVMLPGRDGFSVVRALREAGEFVPVLMLTARGRPEDVLKGFESGADDYLPKPFELAILLARVRGLLRRSRWAREEPREADASHLLAFRGHTLDLDALELHTGDRKYQLTQMECDLLAYLIRNAGKAVSRKAILEHVWAVHEDTDTRAIDNFIVRLRRYIEDDPAKPKLLLTVRSVGYKMVV